jgi:catechol 2,3-dioxygenase-like lactoylglutathione lyase family enzyme
MRKENFMKPKIGIITLGVSDLKRSLTFYRDGLGFPTHEYKEDAGIVFFKLEGTWLALYPRDELVKDIGEDAEKAGLNISSEAGSVGGVTLAHNVKSKEEVDAVVQLAVGAGAKLIKNPQDVFWGGYSGYFADPDGHLWEVAWNPFMDLT